MRLNRGGLVACAVYTLWFAGFFASSFATDVKTGALLTSVSIFPAALFWSVLSAAIGSGDFPFPVDSWLNSIPAYYLESLVLIYLVGWAASTRTAATRQLRRGGPETPELDRAVQRPVSLDHRDD